jgi:hypothetical protein
VVRAGDGSAVATRVEAGSVVSHKVLLSLECDTTLRLGVIKIGGWVRQHPQTVYLHLASSHPGEPLWHLLTVYFALRE